MTWNQSMKLPFDKFKKKILKNVANPVQRIVISTLLETIKCCGDEEGKTVSDAIWLLDQLITIHQQCIKRLLERGESVPIEIVNAYNEIEKSRGGVVHDVGDGEVEKGRKIGSVFESLCRSEESVAEKFDVAKRIRVSEGVVVGDGTGDTCSVSDGGVSLFGFHASYFTKFKTLGWVPRTLLDLAMTSVFAQAMLGKDEGMMWFNLNRKFAWKGL